MHFVYACTGQDTQGLAKPPDLDMNDSILALVFV